VQKVGQLGRHLLLRDRAQRRRLLLRVPLELPGEKF
jgi:hypothetical protein